MQMMIPRLALQVHLPKQLTGYFALQFSGLKVTLSDQIFVKSLEILIRNKILA